MRSFDQRTSGPEEEALLDHIRELQHGLYASPSSRERALASLAGVVPKYPLKVQIQTTTHCNAACEMCPYPDITSEDGFVHQQMSESLYRKLLDQLSPYPVRRLSLFLMNEPLLDRRLEDWLRIARESLPATTLGIFTNGSALTGARARALAEAGLDELCVSVQGFDREIYEASMKKLSYRRLEHNLREVFDLYHRGSLGRLELQIVMGDLKEFSDTLPGADPAFRDHVLLKAFSNEREVVGVRRGLASSPVRGLESSRAAPLCQRPFVKLYVLADGSCILCNVDWNRSVILGRLGGDDEESSVETIWNGEAYSRVRQQHLVGEFPDDSICRNCDYARVVDSE